MYGSKLDETGKEIQAKGVMPLMTGEKVVGCKLVSFGPATNPTTNEVDPNRFQIVFEQSNGKLFTQSYYNNEASWAQTNLNRAMLHICTSFISIEEYYAVVEGSADFVDFMNRIQTKIMPKAIGKGFTLKITYSQQKSSGKWYAGFPSYPNYIELDGTKPSTLTTNPKYDFYTIPVENDSIDNTQTTEEDLF